MDNPSFCDHNARPKGRHYFLIPAFFLLAVVLSINFPVKGSEAASLAWNGPVVIDAAGHGGQPRLAVSSRGNASAVFTDIDPNNGLRRIYARRMLGGTWQPYALPLDNNVVNSSFPDIALSSDNNGAAVFLEYYPAGPRVYANLLVNGNWTGPVQVDYVFTNNIGDPPRITLSSDGNGLVTFAAGQDVYVVPLKSGSWQTPVKLSGQPASSPRLPVAALSSDGRGLAVFYAFDSWYARHLVNGVWGPLDAFNCSGALIPPYTEAQIALPADGTGMVALTGCDLFGTVDVMQNDLFSHTADLMLTPRDVPRAAVAPDGSGLMVFTRFNQAQVFYNTFDGSTWGQNAILDNDLSSYTASIYADVALAYYHNGLAVFYKQDPQSLWHLFSKRLEHGSWQPSEEIGSSGVSNIAFGIPHLALAPDGSAVVVFAENDHIYANTFYTPPAPVAKVTPKALDFGKVHQGQTSPTEPVTVANIGSAPLALSGVTVTGVNPGDFSTTDSLATLNPGEAVILDVGFTPAQLGLRQAQLTINDNAYDSPQLNPLSGTGLGPANISVNSDIICQSLDLVVNGSNFPYNSALGWGTVRISIDSSPVVTTTTQPNGTFHTQFMVPPLTGNSHVISAEDVNMPTAFDSVTVRSPLTGLPVIFVPGVSGSTLSALSAFNYIAPPDSRLTSDSLPLLPEAHTYAAGEKVWLDGIGVSEAMNRRSRYFDTLQLNPDGFTPKADLLGNIPDIGVTGMLYQVPWWARTTNIYGSMRDYLVNQGYMEGQNLFFYPYDWRKDINLSVDGLEALIDQVRTASGQNKVILLAHSMGGLVLRSYLLRYGDAKVDQVITLGTPFLGAPKVAKVLELGDDWDVGVHLGDIGAGAHPKEFMKLAQNYPSAYEMIPSELWYRPDINDPTLDPRYLVRSTIDLSGLHLEPLDFNQAKSFLDSHHNAYLDSVAAAFQGQGIGDLSQPGGDAIIQRIIGIWLPTIGHIYYTPRQASASTCLTPLGPCWTATISLPESAIPREDLLGDGTVPEHSANGFHFPVPDRRVYYLPGVEHMDLVSDANALYITGEMVAGRMCNGSQFATSQYPLKALQDSSQALSASQLLTSTLTSGLEVNLIGSASLDVYDSAGQHTGPLAGSPYGYETRIPYSGYDTTGSVQIATLVAGGAYTVTLHGSQAQGAAMLRLSTLSGGVVTETLPFEGVPITATTAATLTFQIDNLTHLPGNVAFVTRYQPDWSLQAVQATGVLTGTASQDLLPPTVSLTLDLGSHLVTISAQDEPGGSGVQHIYYSIEPIPIHFQEYSGPFTQPPGNIQVSAFAVDRADNASPTVQFPYLVLLPMIQR